MCQLVVRCQGGAWAGGPTAHTLFGTEMGSLSGRIHTAEWSVLRPPSGTGSACVTPSALWHTAVFMCWVKWTDRFCFSMHWWGSKNSKKKPWKMAEGQSLGSGMSSWSASWKGGLTNSGKKSYKNPAKRVDLYPTLPFRLTLPSEH